MEALKTIRLSRFRHSVASSSSTSSASGDITLGSDVKWSLVGDGKDHLLDELERLYWDGIAAEVENIVRTLRAWQQQPELAGVKIADESDRRIHGYDTFLDNVSQESRAFAIRYCAFPSWTPSIFRG
jgi:hypothetical protein